MLFFLGFTTLPNTSIAPENDGWKTISPTFEIVPFQGTWIFFGSKRGITFYKIHSPIIKEDSGNEVQNRSQYHYQRKSHTMHKGVSPNQWPTFKL